VIKNNNEKGKVVDCMAKTRFVEKKALRPKGFEVSFPSDTQKRT